MDLNISNDGEKKVTVITLQNVRNYGSALQALSPLALYSPVLQAEHAPFNSSYFALQEILFVPPEHVPQPLHPVHLPVPTVLPPPPPSKLPVHVCVDPLYEHVPFAILHDSVHD